LDEIIIKANFIDDDELEETEFKFMFKMFREKEKLNEDQLKTF